MRILIATDAWHPQVNGVVRTYTRIQAEAARLGAELVFLTPAEFRHFSCPGYPEIHLALASASRVARLIEQAVPDRIHIATEGPVGWATRRYCMHQRRPFTTSYHTKFPEYAAALLGVPPALTYSLVRRFHAPSAGIMVATPSLNAELRRRGFARLVPWTRGVETELFHPQDIRLFGRTEPVFLYAGRVSREKNIEAFLGADLPGRKIVVGDGPYLPTLKRRYRDVVFTGQKTGADLARHYASADVLVFPSKTDTFGLVLLEAMACGLPVAAYPVTGPIDIVENGRSGILDWDLGRAARRALTLRKSDARNRALKFTWRNAAALFLDNIRLAHERAIAGARGPGQPAFPIDPAVARRSFNSEMLTHAWK
jgi:glycosyltransferase involved in cell wall biosynthesis